MYLEHFGLLEPPFSIAPDPRYLFMSEHHRDALAHLLYGMDSNGAFILLTGEVGTGKTTVSRCLLEQVPENTNLALVLNPKLSAIELLQVICDELRVPYNESELSVKLLVDYINRYLLSAHAKGKKTVILIEEAQNLDLDVLEQLRLLTNLETNERKLLQVILLGQPELLEVLDRPELSQLAQRITARFHIMPLNLDEVGKYIGHRLAIAGCRRPLFHGGVIKQIYKYSGGVPRLINVICDRALLGCYVSNRFEIDQKIVAKAAKETLGERKAANIKSNHSPVKNTKKIALLSVIFLLLVSALYFSGVIHLGPSEHESVDSPVVESVPEISESKVDVAQDAEPDAKEVEKTVVPVVAEAIHSQSVKVEPVKVEPAKVEPEKTATSGVVQRDETQVNEDIMWPEDNQRLRSNIQAYQSLFERWDLSYNLIRHGTPCHYAETQGLSCLHEQATVEDLRKLNRPAVLKLQDDLNRPQYIALLELGQDTAKIAISKKVQTISLKQLKEYWKGEFTMLWRFPPGYKGEIKPGNTGETIVWLGQMLNKMDNRPDNVAGSYYDSNLIRRVKKFQLSREIDNGGVVDAKTLIFINQIVGKKTPMLESS